MFQTFTLYFYFGLHTRGHFSFPTDIKQQIKSFPNYFSLDKKKHPLSFLFIYFLSVIYTYFYLLIIFYFFSSLALVLFIKSLTFIYRKMCAKHCAAPNWTIITINIDVFIKTEKKNLSKNQIKIVELLSMALRLGFI